MKTDVSDILFISLPLFAYYIVCQYAISDPATERAREDDDSRGRRLDTQLPVYEEVRPVYGVCAASVYITIKTLYCILLQGECLRCES